MTRPDRRPRIAGAPDGAPASGSQPHGPGRPSPARREAPQDRGPLRARPSAGERVAVENARDRIRRRLEQLEKSERAIEFRFSLPDAWSKSLFIALLRRYGIEPYRYSGQRRTTVMARVTRTFAEEVLWPEYQQLNATLREHLESVTRRVIARAIHGDPTDARERPGREPKTHSARGIPDLE